VAEERKNEEGEGGFSDRGKNAPRKEGVPAKGRRGKEKEVRRGVLVRDLKRTMGHRLDTAKEEKESQEGINGWHGEKKERESCLNQILYVLLYVVICAAPLVIILFSELKLIFVNYFLMTI
jgi:hypothetical protein